MDDKDQLTYLNQKSYIEWDVRMECDYFYKKTMERQAELLGDDIKVRKLRGRHHYVEIMGTTK